MGFLFNEFLTRPIFNILVWLYNVIPGSDFGLAILVLTLFIRIIFFPLTMKSLVAQRELAKLQPKLKELQQKHKNDKQQLGAATMAMYKEHSINPLSGCLPLLVQLPVLFALFRVLNTAFDTESLGLLYGFVGNPGTLDSISFSFLDLAARAPALAVVAGGLQFFQAKMTAKNQPSGADQSPAAQMSKQMLYFFPIMVIIIAWNFPAGLVLYWAATTGFSIIEHMIINRRVA